MGNFFKFEPVHMRFGRVGLSARETIERMHFVWPRPMKSISIDPARNALAEEVECAQCGQERYTYKHENIVFPSSAIAPVDVFYVSGLGNGSPVFATEDYVAKFHSLNISSVSFREAGATDPHG